MSRRYISACFLLIAMSLPLHAEEQVDAPGEFYIIEVQDCFQPPELNVGTSKDLKVAQKAVSGRNKAISLAFKETAKDWADTEKERVEKAREEAKKQKKKKKDAPRVVRRPFLIKEPGLISLRADGPFESLDEAAEKAQEREEAIIEAVDFKAAAAQRKLEMMSEQARKSHEEQLKLKEEQTELFLKQLDALAGKSAMLASGNRTKRLGGKITRLVTNTHRMKKPKASAQTATKVDQRAVRD